MATVNHAAVLPTPSTSNTSFPVTGSTDTLLTPATASDFEDVELPATEVFPELDPHFEPTYRKFRGISICISLVVILRSLNLGFLCFPWALKSFLNFPYGYDEEFILYQVIDIESFIIPEELREETMVRYVLAMVFSVDLIVCVVVSIIGLYIRNIAWSSFLCIIWICFMIITFVIYSMGLLMFFFNNQYFTIFYIDMILLPTLMVLVICAIRCLRVWSAQGYERFVQPYTVVIDKPNGSKEQDPVPEKKGESQTANPVGMPHQQPHRQPQSISFQPQSQPIPKNTYGDYNDNRNANYPRKSITPSSTKLVTSKSSSIFAQDTASILKQDAAKLFRDDAMLAERRKSKVLEDDNHRLERRKSRVLDDDNHRLERRKSRAITDSDDYRRERRKSRARDDSDDYRYERRKSRAREDSVSVSSRDIRRKSRVRSESDSSEDKRGRSRARDEDHHRKDRRKSRTTERSRKSKSSKHHRK